MKTPTQEEVRDALLRLRITNTGTEDFPTDTCPGCWVTANHDWFDGWPHKKGCPIPTLRAGLEAKAHSEADCLRVAAEWLMLRAASRRASLGSAWMDRYPWEALRAEADRLDARKTE